MELTGCKAALLGAALALGAAGCDAQAESTYPGEPLATIHGTVTNSVPGVPDVTMAVVGDNPFDGTDPIKYAGSFNKIAVTGSFPAHFQIAFYQPPGDGPFFIGHLAAIWTQSPDFAVNAADCILGHTNYYVVYLNQNVPADRYWTDIFYDIPDAGPVGIPDAGRPLEGHPTTVGDYWGHAMTKGFHLVTRRGVKDGQATGFDEVASGLDTDIQVEISGAVGPDCRPPRQYPYDGGVP